MLKNIQNFILSTLFILIICTASWGETFPSEAIITAENFIKTLDNENLEQAYDNAAPLLQVLNPKEEWINTIHIRKDLMGPALSRTVKAVKKTSVYSGLPDGHYVLVYFETIMENKAKAAEVVLSCQEAGSWQVCSYSIK